MTHVIRIEDTGFASGAMEAAEFFLKNKRATRVKVSNRDTDLGHPAHYWEYRGQRKCFNAVYAGMEMKFGE